MFATETERMDGRIEKYSDVLLRLVLGDGRSERDCLRYGRIEVANLKVEMHH